jgi:hypothetical protein
MFVGIAALCAEYKNKKGGTDFSAPPFLHSWLFTSRRTLVVVVVPHIQRGDERAEVHAKPLGKTA